MKRKSIFLTKTFDQKYHIFAFLLILLIPCLILSLNIKWKKDQPSNPIEKIDFAEAAKSTSLSGYDDIPLRGSSGETILGMGTLTAVAVSPNNRILATAGQIGVFLWNLDEEKPEPFEWIEGFSQDIASLCFSPDNKRIAIGSADGCIAYWNLDTKTASASFRAHAAFPVYSLRFISEGKHLLSGGGGGISLWNAKNGVLFKLEKGTGLWNAGDGVLLKNFRERGLGFTSFDLSGDDSRLLAGSRNGMLCVWNFRSEKMVKTIHTDQDEITAVAFLPDGKRYVAGSKDGRIQMWDDEIEELEAFISGGIHHYFHGHSSPIHTIRFLENGKTMLSADQNSIKLWNMDNGKIIRTIEAECKEISSVQLLRQDTQILVQGKHGELELLDLDDGKGIWTLNEHSDFAFGQLHCMRNDRELCLVDLRRGIRILDYQTRQIVHEWLTPEKENLFIRATSPNGRYVVTNNLITIDSDPIYSFGNNTATLWDSQTGEKLSDLKEHPLHVRCAEFTRKGKTLLTGSIDGTMKLWDVETGGLLHSFVILQEPGYQGGATKIQLSPSEQYCLVTSEGRNQYGNRITVHKLFDLEEKREIPLHHDDKYGFIFTPDEKHLLVQTLKLVPDPKRKNVRNAVYNLFCMNMFTGEAVFEFEEKVNFYRALFSPDHRYFITIDYEKAGYYGPRPINIWDMSNGGKIRTLAGHSAYISEMKFSPDGKHLFTASGDTTIKLWDIETGKEIHIFAGHTKAVNTVLFHPNQRLILSHGEDGTIRVWDIPSCDLTVRF